MAIFKTEKAMQEWLGGRLFEVEGLASLIVNKADFSTPRREARNVQAVSDSFVYALKSLHVTVTISEDSNVSNSMNEVLKPDFLLYAVDTEGIVIVELKNLAGPSRQAGTEAGAYAAAVRSHVPFIPDGDMVNVILSSDWPTLLCRYVAHEIEWIGRRIICLRPVVSSEGAIALEIVEPDKFATFDLPRRFAEDHLGGYQMCLYDTRSGVTPGDHGSLSRYRPHMRTTLRAMADCGNALRGHGFAFLWKGRGPFAITMVGFSAFQGFERFMTEDPVAVPPTRFQADLLSVIEDHRPRGRSQTLEEVAAIARMHLSRICSPTPEGHFSWPELRGPLLQGGIDVIAFCGWGVFGERFLDTLLDQHLIDGGDVPPDDPTIGMAVVNDLLDTLADPETAWLRYMN